MIDMQMPEKRLHSRSGWKDEETNMLLSEVKNAEKEGRPIKSVFDRVALITGRKPNSIRNYYYLKLKDDDKMVGRINSFVPFKDDEISVLIEQVLTEQAKGRSVRSIAMSLGGGDRKQMLRFQNKYRSTIKNNPEIVYDTMQRLKQTGKDYVNPYEQKTRKKMHTKQQEEDVIGAISEMARNIEVAGLDYELFINCLCSLSKKAAQFVASKMPENTELYNDKHLYSGIQSANVAMAKQKAVNEQLKQQNELLEKQCEDLKAMLSKQVKINDYNTEKINELVALNKSFIELKGMLKISGLSEYVYAVEKCIGKLG